ncbi:MAG: hypothetical protein DWP95_06350 [Proteobacteria bacterium]|nr:MAG: hypothetical protein DWP95_06350 [Pseudomonadota bacterium]
MNKPRFSFYHKERKNLWGRSRVWLILAVLSFIIGWLFLHMLDRYLALQPELLKLSAPPNLSDALLLPLSHNLIKVMLLLFAVTAGNSVAQERQEGTLDYVLRLSPRPWYRLPIMAKFKSHLWLAGFPVLTLLVTAALLSMGGKVDWLMVTAMLVALILCCSWLIALALWLSSMANQSGFGVLLTLVVYMVMWIMGGQTALDEYGINWLNLLLPEQHFNWLSQGQLNLSSIFYFVGGTWFFIAMAQSQIQRLKWQQ